MFTEENFEQAHQRWSRPHDPSCDPSEGATVSAVSILDAIQGYLDNVADGNEVEPAAVGACGHERRRIIFAALALAIAKAVRKCARNTQLAPALLYCVAIRSDNDHGRCTDGVFRIADYLGCGEDAVRDVRDALATCGALRVDRRPGGTDCLWLPYVSLAQCKSANAIMEAIAPPRARPGRPRKAEPSKPPGVSCPTVSEKPRVSRWKTPGVATETPGRLMPDCKNSSLQVLYANNQGEARMRAHLSASPKKMAFNKSEVQGGAAGLWAALQGQGLLLTRSHNKDAMHAALANCPWVARLSADEALDLARVAAKAMSEANKGFWPTTGALSECARNYFAACDCYAKRLQEYRVRSARYQEWKRQRDVASKIDDEIPRATTHDCGTKLWQTATDERWAKIKDRQAAEGIDLDQFKADNFERFPPVEPSNAARFNWPTSQKRLGT